jgi:hypothetical protein
MCEYLELYHYRTKVSCLLLLDPTPLEREVRMESKKHLSESRN